MTTIPPATVAVWDASPVQSALNAFPIACFTLALLTDIAYWQTANLLWLHFSEWLLLAGLLAGILAALAYGLDYLLRGMRPSWPAVLAGIGVLVLAALNSFIHTADGWTAVVPMGLALSAVTVLAMIATAFLAHRGVRHD